MPKGINKALQEAEHLMIEMADEKMGIFKRSDILSEYQRLKNQLDEAMKPDPKADEAFIQKISNGIDVSVDMESNVRYKGLTDAWGWRNWHIKEWVPWLIDIKEFEGDEVCTRLLKMSCKAKGFMPWFEENFKT